MSVLAKFHVLTFLAPGAEVYVSSSVGYPLYGRAAPGAAPVLHVGAHHGRVSSTLPVEVRPRVLAAQAEPLLHQSPDGVVEAEGLFLGEAAGLPLGVEPRPVDDILEGAVAHPHHDRVLAHQQRLQRPVLAGDAVSELLVGELWAAGGRGSLEVASVRVPLLQFTGHRGADDSHVGEPYGEG